MSIGERLRATADDSESDDDSEWASRNDADALDAALAVAVDTERLTAGSSAPPVLPRRELAVLGDTCAICLQALANAALVRACFHAFCLECLSAWVQTQALHGLERPTCPLCKARFDSALTNVASESDFDEVRFHGRHTVRHSSTSEQLQRRSLVYRRRMRLVTLNGVYVASIALPVPLKLRGEYDAWLRRELEACIGTGLDLTVLVSLIQCCVDKVHRSDVARGYRELETALQPFLYDDATIFARELAFFLGSRFNMDAYDAVLEYSCSSSETCTTGQCGGGFNSHTS